MFRSVTILLAFFTVLTISGCAEKTVYVPQKCVVPTVEQPMIDYNQSNSLLEEAKRCAYNYFQMKEYADRLNKASETCK
jgi:hypothetical protein